MNRSAWFIILALAIPSVAWGYDFAWSSPDEDRSIYYLGQIFGQMGTVLMGSGNQIIGDLLRIFNIAVLTVGTIVVVYSVVVSTISTAQEGEVMGKKFSSIWIPIRSASGLALLLPTVSGFSLIQILMMWIVIQGVHGANQMWFLLMDKMQQGQGITSTLKVNDKEMVKQAIGVFQAAVCINRLNNDDAFLAATGGKRAEMYYPPSTEPDYKRYIYFGVDDPDSPFEKLCGTIEAQTILAYPHARSVDQWNRQQLAAGELAYLSMSSDAKEAADYPDRYFEGSDMWEGQGTLRDGALSMTGPITQIDLRDMANDCGSSSDAGWRDFLESLNMPEDVISTMVPPCTNDVITAARQDGWIHASNYFFKLIKASNPAVHAPVPPPKFNPPPAGYEPYNNWLKEVMPLAIKYLKNSDKMPPGGTVDISSVNISDPPGLSEEAKTALGGTAKEFNHITKHYIAHLSNRDDDPISSFQKTGTEIMITVEVLFFVIVIALPIAMTLACIISGLNPACFILGLVVVILVPVFMIIMSLIWSAGVAIGLYLPMIPYFVYTFTALGWIMLVVETIVAAPIVALGLTTPGQEALGKATPAVMLITNVFLRPSLMLIGLIAATRLLKPVINMINFGFEGFVLMNVGELLLFGNIVLIVIYAGVAITAFHQIFSLVYVLPDKVIRWIGGQAEQSQVEKMLDEAQKASQAGAETASKLAKAAGAVAVSAAKDKMAGAMGGEGGEGGEGEGGGGMSLGGGGGAPGGGGGGAGGLIPDDKKGGGGGGGDGPPGGPPGGAPGGDGGPLGAVGDLASDLGGGDDEDAEESGGDDVTQGLGAIAGKAKKAGKKALKGAGGGASLPPTPVGGDDDDEDAEESAGGDSGDDK